LGSKILRDAIKQRQGIGIFEITSRSLKGLFENLILTPLIMTVFAPFIRPFSFTRLFCLWVIPILQLLFMFDGVISSLRTYSPEELRELIEAIDKNEPDLGVKNYTFEIKKASCGLFGLVDLTYLIGIPNNKKEN